MRRHWLVQFLFVFSGLVAEQLHQELLRNQFAQCSVVDREEGLAGFGGDDILKFRIQYGWSINPGYPEPRTFLTVGVFLKLPAVRNDAP